MYFPILLLLGRNIMSECCGGSFVGSLPPPLPFIMTVPSPMGMANMVVKVKALMATGLPRVPRTMYLHVGLFSQIHDMSRG